MVPSEVQIAFGVQFGLGNAFDAVFDSKTPTILEPKFIPNAAGSNQKSKTYVPETNLNSMSFFETIFMKF